MGFPRQEYWSGLPFPSPGDLPDPCITGRFFTTEPAHLAKNPVTIITRMGLECYFKSGLLLLLKRTTVQRGTIAVCEVPT